MTRKPQKNEKATQKVSEVYTILHNMVVHVNLQNFPSQTNASYVCSKFVEKVNSKDSVFAMGASMIFPGFGKKGV